MRAELLKGRNVNIIRSYTAGNSMQEIAVLFELTDTRVWQILVENKVPRRTRGRYKLGRVPRKIRKPYMSKKIIQRGGGQQMSDSGYIEYWRMSDGSNLLVGSTRAKKKTDE